MAITQWLNLEVIIAVLGFLGVGVAGPLKSYLLPEIVTSVSQREVTLQLDYLFVINAWVAAAVSLLTKAQQLQASFILIAIMIILLGMFVRLLSFRARAYVELQPWVRVMYRTAPVSIVILLQTFLGQGP